MLFDKSYDDNALVTFKLVNGDEIVARVESCVSGGWRLSKPCTVVPSHQGIGLIQSLFSADINKTVELKFEHVMMHAPTIQQLEAHYIKTTTGIETVSKGPILV
jgi:hypothetical protein